MPLGLAQRERKLQTQLFLHIRGLDKYKQVMVHTWAIVADCNEACACCHLLLPPAEKRQMMCVAAAA